MTESEPDVDSGEPADRDGTGEEASREFLIETVRRSPLLAELRSSPARPSELADSLDVSRSTVHRAIKSLEDRNLIRRREGRYELTGVGRVVSAEADTYRRRVETAMSLEPFLDLVEMDDIPLGLFAETTVTEPTPRQPHFSVKRIMELIERSDSLRIFSTIISPFYVDVAYREMLDGTEVEAIFDERIVDIVLDEYSQQAQEAFETGRFDVYAHPNLPFELFLFDDRLGMAAHDENGIARVFVETESPAAVEWGEELFERRLEESTSLTPSNG